MRELHTEHDAGVVTVTLNRPPVNALNTGLCRAVRDAFRAVGESGEARCVILASAGDRAFCAGLDLREVFDTPEGETLRATVVREMYTAVYDCAVPVIAAVQGPALGAGSVLATVCDVRIASARATFGLPEIDVGRIGGAAHHGRLVPQGTLRRMVFTGQPLSADEAHRVGLVDELTSGDPLPAARRLASIISGKGAVGLRHAKASLNAIEALRFDQGYRHEQGANVRLRQTEDGREASRAALEKRPPKFRGR